MAKFSMKKMGKEVGPAELYAPPHTMEGRGFSRNDIGNGYKPEPTRANKVNMSVGNITRDGYDPDPKTTGIKMRGTGAATKGVMSRGPMA
jgi:hypothetical protein